MTVTWCDRNKKSMLPWGGEQLGNGRSFAWMYLMRFDKFELAPMMCGRFVGKIIHYGVEQNKIGHGSGRVFGVLGWYFKLSVGYSRLNICVFCKKWFVPPHRVRG